MARKAPKPCTTSGFEELEFKRIKGSNEDIHALYRLLQVRENNISHTEIPSFAEHTEFVKNHPYRFWYLIQTMQAPIGSVYFHFDNSIGVSIPGQTSALVATAIRKAVSLHRPLRAVKSVRSNRFYINSSPENQQLRQALNFIHWEILQISYAAPRDTCKGDTHV